MTAAELAEANRREDSNLFYKRLGELCFTSESQVGRSGSPTGNVKRLAVSNSYGVTVFVDAKGLYVGNTKTYLDALQRWDEDSEQPPVDRCRVCRCSIDWPAVTSVQLTAQDQLLVAHDAERVKLYSLQSVVQGGSSESVLDLQLSQGGIGQLCIANGVDSSNPLAFAMVTKEKRLYTGTFPEFPGTAVSSGVTCTAWSPDGTWLARGEQDTVVVRDMTSGGEWRQSIRCRDAGDENELSVDSLVWLSGHQLLVGISIQQEGREEDIAPVGVLQWAQETPHNGATPAGAKFYEFDEVLRIVPEATIEPTGPYVLSCSIPEWKLMLFAHRKSPDEHVKLLDYSAAVPETVDILEDKLMLRVPNAAGDEDNYVIGMAVDYSSTGDIPVLHPTDDTAPALPPSPALMLATSDGKLRAYTFSDVQKTTSIVRPPQPLQPLSPQLEAVLTSGVSDHAVAASTPLPGDEAAAEAEDDVATAAATALPEAEDELEDKGEGGEAAVDEATRAVAASTALPSDTDESQEEEEWETTTEEEEEEEEAVSMPQPTAPSASNIGKAQPEPTTSAPPATAPAFSLPPFGSASPLPPTAPSSHPVPVPSLPTSTPAMSPVQQPAPAGPIPSTSASSAASSVAPSTLTFGGFGSTTGPSAFNFGGVGAAAPGGLLSSGTAGGAAVSVSSAPSRPSSSTQENGKSTVGIAAAAAPRKASQPPIPSVSDMMRARQMQARVMGGTARDKGQPVSSGISAASAAQAQAPAPTGPPMAAPKATHVEADEDGQPMSALEKDFVKSLRELRLMSDQMSHTLHQFREGTMLGNTPQQQQQPLKELTNNVAELSEGLAKSREALKQLQADLKDEHMRCMALQDAWLDGNGGQAAADTPLPPALAALRDDIIHQLQVLTARATELDESLEDIEKRHRGFPKLPSAQHFYNAVASQAAVANHQLETINSMLGRVSALGVYMSDVEDEEQEEQPGRRDDMSTTGPRKLSFKQQGPSGSPFQTPVRQQRGTAFTMATSTSRTPATNRSSGRPQWQSLKHSPASALKSSVSASICRALSPVAQRSAPHSSSSSSMWNQQGANRLQGAILAAAASGEGGTRVQRLAPQRSDALLSGAAPSVSTAYTPRPDNWSMMPQPGDISGAAVPHQRPPLPAIQRDFIASMTFAGAKLGFVFTTRDKGVGYYRDTPPTVTVPASIPVRPQLSVPSGQPPTPSMAAVANLKYEVAQKGIGGAQTRQQSSSGSQSLFSFSTGVSVTSTAASSDPASKRQMISTSAQSGNFAHPLGVSSQVSNTTGVASSAPPSWPPPTSLPTTSAPGSVLSTPAATPKPAVDSDDAASENKAKRQSPAHPAKDQASSSGSAMTPSQPSTTHAAAAPVPSLQPTPSPAAPPKPKPKASSQPPVPSMAAFKAAQQKFSGVLGAKPAAPGAPSARPPAAAAASVSSAPPPTAASGEKPVFNFAPPASSSSAPAFVLSAAPTPNTSAAPLFSSAPATTLFGSVAASSAQPPPSIIAPAASPPSSQTPVSFQTSAPLASASSPTATSLAPTATLFGGFSSGVGQMGGGFGSIGQPAASASSSAASPATLFGSSPQAPPAQFGFPSSAASPTPSGIAAGFSGLGFGASSAAASLSSATSTAAGGKGMDFGTAGSQPSFGQTTAGGSVFGGQPPATSTPSLFSASSPALGFPAAAPPAAPFGATSTFSQPTAPVSPFGAPAAVGGGFGQPGAMAGSPFGAASGGGAMGGGTGGFGAGFGQPAAFGSSLAVPSSPGITSGFGQPATPGFGSPATPGIGGVPSAFGGASFGSAAPSGGNPFGAAAAGGNAFAAMAGNQGSGFGGMSAQPPGGGFSSFSQAGGGGFGAMGGGGFGAMGGGFGGASQSPASSSSNLWAPRK